MQRNTSRRGMRRLSTPPNTSMMGISNNNAKLTRVCARIAGPSGGSAFALGISFAVNTAFPKLAEMAQQKAAPAIYRYPLMGCGLESEWKILVTLRSILAGARDQSRPS